MQFKSESLIEIIYKMGGKNPSNPSDNCDCLGGFLCIARPGKTTQSFMAASRVWKN